MNAPKHLISMIMTSLLLTACGSSDDGSAQSQTVDTAVAGISQAGDEPAIGTAVVDVIAKQGGTAETSEAKDYNDILWDDLLPPDFNPEAILERYQDEILAAPEGSMEERILFDKVMGEINSAGANKAMDQMRVRVPGYVAPLETNGDMVGDFLLVPYYGSCIHAPPPPMHQTVLVNPQVGKSINLRQTYRPVWVTGTIPS